MNYSLVKKLGIYTLSTAMVLGLAASCKFFKGGSTSINGAVKSPPVLEIEQTIYDFGELQTGEIVSHVFTYTNEGKTNLTIDSVDAGSKKINVKWYPVTVKPGKEGNIEVTYNSTGDLGKQVRPVILYTNATEKKAHVVVTAKVNSENIN